MPQYLKKLSKGDRWFFKFDLNGKTYRSKAIYLTKQEAKKAEAERYQEADYGQRHPNQSQEIGLLQAIDERLDYVKVRKTLKYYNDNRRYLSFLKHKFGNVSLVEIKKGDIESLLQSEAMRGAYTVNAMLRCYKALFNHAIDSYDLDIKNPCIKIKLFAVEKRIKYIPTDTEINTLLEACTESQRRLIEFIRDTGARLSEALNLKGKDISNVSVTLYTRKSKNSNLVPRKVPKPDCLVGTIFPADKNVFSEWSEYPKFLDRKIRQLKQHTWGFHSLRHRRASLWSKEGKPLFEIMSLLGHSQITTTQIYLQMLPDSGDDLVTERIEYIEYKAVHRI